jgi:glycosyltransferase involved in cell wall biosynthesis
MRVGLVVEQCLAPVPGGTGRYAYEVAAALARSAPPGSTVTGWSAWHRHPGAAVVPGVRGPRRLPLGRRTLTAAWERGVGPAPRTVDLVHAPTLLFPPRRWRPLVVTMHDTVPWTHPETLTARGVAWHRAAAARAAREADLVVVPTEAVATELAELLPLRARPLVVGEGVSAGLVVPPDADQRAARLRLPTGGYLATLATLEPRKGLDVAIAALARPGAPALPLLVAGQPGWGGLDLPGAAAARGLAPDRLRLLGRLDDADLAVLLSRAIAVVLPSRAEGFGLPLLEAMSLGTPTVIADAPALVEVAGGAALVVPREDAAALAAALGRLAADASLRGGLAAAGRRRAAAYSWDDAAGRLWTAYAELLAP